MQPLKVVAELENSFASSDPWSPSIDGILAYWHMRKKLGDAAFAASSVDSSKMQPVDDLPIEKAMHGDLWWYKCSSPIYDKQAGFLRYFHRRFDAYLAEHCMVPKRGAVSVKAGPFKNFRLSTNNIVAREIVWHVLGEKSEIKKLLSRCHFVGAKTGSGNGRVLRWRFEEGGDATIAEKYRPLPIEEKMPMDDSFLMDWGLRPPVRIAANRAICVMPI